MKELAAALAELSPGEWILLTVLIIVLAGFAAFLVVAVLKAVRPMRDERGRWRMDDGKGDPLAAPAAVQPGCASVCDHEQILTEIKENVLVLYKVMLPLLTGVKASLEAVQGKINGNVDKAIEEISDATATMQKHLVERIR